MFSRKKAQPESVISARPTESTKSGPSSGSVTGRPSRVRGTAERIRPPDSQIGIAKLLEVYDDYPHVLDSLEITTERLELAEERKHEAEVDRAEALAELKSEKEGRAADAETAKKEKRQAELDVDKKVRGELDPKIKDLQRRLKLVEEERDKTKKELLARTSKMSGWISGMEKLQKERELAEQREVKAAEDKKKVDVKLKEMDVDILDGLRELSKLPVEEEKPAVVSDGTSVRGKTPSIVTNHKQ
ncbi:hypothetical protein CI109_104454 [Kwoniella shandongensis]|uniref:Uncharacterized protein n=1 Tax=Kwoniella shandongensis TaxID=1734106 RepID=A0A5M6BN96_9TREE|nr:uncharacterized protein CI109_007304 [Kwoniella shandongensis]KAA5524356.1 hypothetical protein CI109_007304 [Kwoniella shandongensis]